MQDSKIIHVYQEDDINLPWPRNLLDILSAGVMGGVDDVVVVSSFMVTFLAAVDVPDTFVVLGLAVVLCPAVDDAFDVAFVAIGLVVAGTAGVVGVSNKIGKLKTTISIMDLLFFSLVN